MNAIGSFFRRTSQTQTEVHDEKGEKEQRIISLRAAYRNIAAIQTTTQLLVWLVLWLYGDIYQTSWQAMLLQLIPALLVWLAWAFIPQRVPSAASIWLRLLLLPCLWLDSIVLLTMLSMFCQLQLPTWPNYAVALGILVFTWVSVAFSGHHGVAYGIGQLRWVVAALLLGSVTLHDMPEWKNLWPILGLGTNVTLRAALLGIGGTWGVALLFTTPRDSCAQTKGNHKRVTLFWTLIPVSIVIGWTFYICTLAPWPSAIPLAYKEAMTVLNWYGGNLLLLTFSTILWLVLLSSSVSANAMYATNFICQALPKLPKKLVTLLYLVPATVCAMLPNETTLDTMINIMPYRLALALLVGLFTLFVERRRKA